MKIVKTTYKDQVIKHIYELVLEGILTPGERIKESILAKELGISRAPIREALKELSTSGIIVYKPQVGSFVAQLSPKEIIDAYTTRGVLEGYAIMETMTEFTAKDLEKLIEMANSMQEAALKKRHKAVIQIGGEFHNLLISKNNNKQLMEYTERLSKKLHVLFYQHWAALYSPTEIGNRHKKIVEVIKNGASHLIEAVVREHYVETGTKIVKCQKDSPLPHAMFKNSTK